MNRRELLRGMGLMIFAPKLGRFFRQGSALEQWVWDDVTPPFWNAPRNAASDEALVRILKMYYRAPAVTTYNFLPDQTLTALFPPASTDHGQQGIYISATHFFDLPVRVSRAVPPGQAVIMNLPRRKALGRIVGL